ncbi:MAG: lycopene cyclase domain protein [Ilumatobacteraceae bacterium]|nr:lycopene cyclase domain protein [Ilumatobacteraceae bacterium]
MAGCLVLTLPLGGRVWRRPKRLVRSVLPVALVFIAGDLWATERGDWSFDRRYTIGWRLPGGMAVEELLSPTSTNPPGGSIPEPAATVTAASVHSLIASSALTPALAGVCSSVVNFLSTTFNSLFAALTIPTSAETPPVLAFLAFLGNTAIGLAKTAIEGLANRFAKELLLPFTTGIEALGVATLVISFFTNQTLDVSLDPQISDGVYVFSVDGTAPIKGTFVAKAKDLTDDWPATLVDCAKAAGADLPKLIEPGADANWTVVNDFHVITPGPLTTKVGGDLTARLDFTTGSESQELHDTGIAQFESAVASVSIPRKAINTFLDLVKSQISGAEAALLSSIPAGGERDAAIAALKSAVDPTINSLGDAASKQLGGIFSLTGTASVPVKFHSPAETTTTVPPPQAFEVVMDRPAVAPLLAGRVVDLISCDGVFGHWTGVIRDGGIDGSGISEPFHDIPLDFTFAASGDPMQTTPATGTATFDTQRGPTTIGLDLQITVDTTQPDASTMSITGTATADNDIVEVGAAIGGLASNLPIQTAPPGSCS